MLWMRTSRSLRDGRSARSRPSVGGARAACGSLRLISSVSMIWESKGGCASVRTWGCISTHVRPRQMSDPSPAGEAEPEPQNTLQPAPMFLFAGVFSSTLRAPSSVVGNSGELFGRVVIESVILWFPA